MYALQTKRVVNTILFTGIGFILIIWGFLVWHEVRIRPFAPDENMITDSDDRFCYYIESLNYEKDEIPTTKDWITLGGWIIQKGKTSERVMIKIVLKNVVTEEYFIIPTTMEKRTDISEYYADGCNYDNSGFRIKIPHNKKIDTDAFDYEVFALYNLNGRMQLISLGKTFKTWAED